MITNFYKFFCKLITNENAAMAALMANTVIWFLVGAMLGVIYASILKERQMAISYIISFGSSMSLVFGYIVGYIRLLNLREK